MLRPIDVLCVIVGKRGAPINISVGIVKAVTVRIDMFSFFIPQVMCICFNIFDHCNSPKPKTQTAQKVIFFIF